MRPAKFASITGVGGDTRGHVGDQALSSVDQPGLFTSESITRFDPAVRDGAEVQTCLHPVSMKVARGETGTTLAGIVAAYFKARPGQWIDGRDLMTVAGSYGWRTRVSDCRRPPYNLRIDNRQRRVGQYTVSEYMLVVDPLAGGAL